MTVHRLCMRKFWSVSRQFIALATTGGTQDLKRTRNSNSEAFFFKPRSRHSGHFLELDFYHLRVIIITEVAY